MTHLLDSSALFAFFFDEPGRDRVEALLRDDATVIGLSALTAVELWARLKAEGREKVFDQEWKDHLPLFDVVVAADLTVSLRAVELRRAAGSRLPTIDSLIAASAALSNAILVHRDPHFAAIPPRLLRQEVLPDK